MLKPSWNADDIDADTNDYSDNNSFSDHEDTGQTTTNRQ